MRVRRPTFHEFLDTLQKTAKEAFGFEAQKVVDKAIYAKMPDHVKKVLNRAYLEDKPYNDTVLHLEREMRLNGRGAPDETTLVRLNTVDMKRKNNSKESIVSTVANMATTRHSVADFERSDTTPTQNRTIKRQIKMNCQNANLIRVKRCTKPETVGTELMRQMTPGNANENSPSQQTRLANNPYLPRRPKQKTKIAAPTLWGKRRAYTIEDPPNRYEEDFFTECNEEPTQDWQRRWNVGMILRHNARHPEDPTSLPQWITESPDSYATLKRPLPESKTERIYIYDRDYRCDPWTNQPSMTQKNSLSKSRFQTLKPNPQRLQIYHHRCHQS